MPSLRRRDAVGEHVLAVLWALRGAGLPSDVYVEHPESPEGEVRSFRDFASRAVAGDVLLYHLPSPSGLSDFVLSRSEPVVLYYHNVTPASFYLSWSEEIARAQLRGRRELERLADRVVLALSPSHFSDGELSDLGFERRAVVPILRHPSARAVPELRTRLALRRARAGGGADWLFVGRLAPNKAQHRLVAAFAAYREAYDPRARLHLVGRADPPSYGTFVQSWVDELGLREAVSIVRGLSAGALAAYYASTDVLVSLSEHEGFCVPLVEAMEAGLPVVALASSAVPETVGDAALLVGTADPLGVAAAVHTVLSDPVRQQAMRLAGRARLAAFASDRVRDELLGALLPVLEEAAP